MKNGQLRYSKWVDTFQKLILALSIPNYLWLQSTCSTFFGHSAVWTPSKMWIAYERCLGKFEVSTLKFYLVFTPWIIFKDFLNHMNVCCRQMHKFQVKFYSNLIWRRVTQDTYSFNGILLLTEQPHWGVFIHMQ